MDESISHLGLLDDDAILLDADALRLAKLDHPDIDLAPYTDLLSDLTERLVLVGGEAASAVDRAAALARVIGGEYGFIGDSETYDDADNADLIRVIERRRGLPVSLAILYVAAARRLGWAADVLNTPAHVLLRIGSAVEPVLVDAFAGGRIVERAELAALLARAAGSSIVPTAEHLAPMSNRAVLVRLLMNQAMRAEAAGRLDRTLVLYRRTTALAPAQSPLWWNRARLEILQGDPQAARASLSAMLETTREPGPRAAIVAALDALAQRM